MRLRQRSALLQGDTGEGNSIFRHTSFVWLIKLRTGSSRRLLVSRLVRLLSQDTLTAACVFIAGTTIPDFRQTLGARDTARRMRLMQTF